MRSSDWSSDVCSSDLKGCIKLGVAVVAVLNLDLRRWIFGHVQAVDLLDVEHDIALEVVAGAVLTVLPLGGSLVGFVILRSEGAGMNDKIALLALPDLDRKSTRLNSSH